MTTSHRATAALWALGAAATVTVDRIEGELAVVEWADTVWVAVPVSELPPGVAEGDRLRIRWHRARRRPRDRAERSSLPSTPRSAVSSPPPHERIRAPQETP